MKKFVAAFVIFIGLTLQVQAREHHHHYHHYTPHTARHEHYRHNEQVAYGYGGNDASARARGLPDCGAYMADVFHFTGLLGRKLWVAANWAHMGVPTSAHRGAVAVWRHHVVRIVGGRDGRGRWLVEDNHGRGGSHEYYRSLSGVIAIRDVGGSSFSIADNYISDSHHSRRERYALRQSSYRPNDDYMNRWQVSQI